MGKSSKDFRKVMPKHFMSVLGTGLYEPVVYGDCEGEDEFVQLADIKLHMEELRSGKITIFLTEGAKERNWLDREYTDKESENAKRWKTKQNIAAGSIKKGMKNQLEDIMFAWGEDAPELQTIDIPDGKNEIEIATVFRKMYDSIENGDEIILDITHGFRSIPMLMMTVLNYAKVMKNCKISGMYYGAYEASEVVDSRKRAPVFDLTKYDEILEWSYAAKQFVTTGSAEMLGNTYHTIYGKKDNPKLHTAISKMRILSDAIATNRGSSKTNTQVKEYKYGEFSIGQAYRQLYNAQEELKDVDLDDNPALGELVRKIVDDYSCLGGKKDYEVGFAVVKLCIDFSLIAQGYTALQETINTFLCYEYSKDDSDDHEGFDPEKKEDRDRIDMVIETIRIGNKKESSDKSKKDDVKSKEFDDENRSDLFYFFAVENSKSKGEYWTNTDKQKLYWKIFQTIPKEIVDVTCEVKDIRNDINHFGRRNNPLSSSKLKDKLSRSYDRIMAMVDKITEAEKTEGKLIDRATDDWMNELTSKGRRKIFVNFSNHPSSDWPEEQKKAAQEYGEVVDVSFPQVDPCLSIAEIQDLAQNSIDAIMAYNPVAVMSMGEFTLNHIVVTELLSRGISVFSATTAREAVVVNNNDGSSTKTAEYRFVAFREYR